MYGDYNYSGYYPANQGHSNNAFSQAAHYSYAHSNYSYGNGGGRPLNANPFYAASANRWQNINTRRESWPPHSYAHTMGNSNSAQRRPAPNQSNSRNTGSNNRGQVYGEYPTSRHGYTYTSSANAGANRNPNNTGSNNIPVQVSNRNTAYINRRQDQRGQAQRRYPPSTVLNAGAPSGPVPRRHSSDPSGTEKRSDFQRQPSGSNLPSGSNALQSGLTSGRGPPAHSLSTPSALSSNSSDASLGSPPGSRGSRVRTHSAGGFKAQGASFAPGLVFQNAAKISPSKPVVTPTKSCGKY